MTRLQQKQTTWITLANMYNSELAEPFLQLNEEDEILVGGAAEAVLLALTVHIKLVDGMPPSSGMHCRTQTRCLRDTLLSSCPQPHICEFGPYPGFPSPVIAQFRDSYSTHAAGITYLSFRGQLRCVFGRGRVTLVWAMRGLTTTTQSVY